MSARTTALPRRGPFRSTQRREDVITAYLCLLPWIIGFLSFTLGPMVFSIGLSLFRADMLTPSRFVGLHNYQELLRDPLFMQSLKVTATYAFVSVPMGAVAAIAVAMLLNQKLVLLGFWRTVYYLPSVVSGVAVSLLWLQIFNPRMGLLNGALKVLGLEGPKWIFDSDWALLSLIIMSVWAVGGNMLLYLAGLQGIPTPLYEAATVDGAGAWHRFWHVTIPMLSPTIFFNVIMGLIGSFQFFSQPFVMTAGGPNNATLSMVLYLYNKAFLQTQFGYASAIAWVLFAIIVCFTLLVIRSSNFWVYYEGEERQ
ncbi:MAG: carbohydrate ABC transporter permease [Anaerolineae bacterium]